MIQVEHISKDFGNKRVLHDLSFTIRKGEILGFLGPNAAGKTTMMRIITGFLPATEGKVSIAGIDVFDQPMKTKRLIGYLPETPPIYPEMKVREYLKFISIIKGVSAQELNSRIDDVMEKCSIADVQNRVTGRLSKGYRQRVGLAQAILHNPPVLIFDEPTSGLDPKQIIETRNLIKDLAGEHTIILSTHILSEVSMTCERVIIIDNGRIIAQDTPEALTDKLKGVEKLALEVGGPKEEIITTLNAVEGVTGVSLQDAANGDRVGLIVESRIDVDIRKEVSRIIAENNWDLYELRAVGMSMEEIFLKLTMREEV
ncbi:ABC transporter ATP-binding protein [candidate division KSB1 bacterium]